MTLTEHQNVSRSILPSWGRGYNYPHPVVRALGVGKGVAGKPSPFPFSSWYYSLHICSILVLLLLPVKKSQRGRSTQENVQLSWAKKFDEGENSLGQNSFATTNNVCNQNRDTASRHSSQTQWLGERGMAVSRLWTEKPVSTPFQWLTGWKWDSLS